MGRADLDGPQSEGKAHNHPLPGTYGEEGEVDKKEMSGLWFPELSLPHP